MPQTVKSILDAKGRNVVSVGRDQSLSAIAAILNEKHIGAVVVTNPEGRIAGIFTERDLVRAIAQNGAVVLEQPVSSSMTTDVTRCREDNTNDELMEMMTAGRFRHVPVESDGKLAGIISIGDVVKSRISEIEHEAEQIKAYIAG
ncbi:CBS domain-containing protein [Neorhizobium sp. NPDC001467]|uniref:CBS domain-containing protein n=1 Tax=Neorhizobium sp. NPDC001467 TaxID=3390595 RepID=UPI003D081145